MKVTRSTLDADSSGYAVEYDGETYSFEVIGSSAVRLVGDRRLPPEVAAEMQSLGFGTVEVSKDFHVRKDDPEDPHIGMRWYRSDRGAVRAQMADGSIEERGVFDAPQTQLIEDFEGASISDFSTFSPGEGSPSYSITDRGGDDWLEIEVSDAQGNVQIPSTEKYLIADVDTDQDAGNIYLAVGGADVGLVQLVLDEDGATLKSSSGGSSTISVPESEIYGQEIVAEVEVKSSEAIGRVETQSDSYEVTLSNIPDDTDDVINVGAEGSASTSEYFFNDLRTVSSQGQLSPALAHSDLADAPASAHHTPPSAGAGIDKNGNAFRTQYVPEDLSQRVGDYDGELAADDGTNTPARGTLCLWDDTNSVWRQQNDPTQTI
jgi:hypothetical protein